MDCQWRAAMQRCRTIMDNTQIVRGWSHSIDICLINKIKFLVKENSICNQCVNIF